MGAQASIIWYVNSRHAHDELAAGVTNEKHSARSTAERLFPHAAIESLGTASLADAAAPGPDQLYVGSYGALTVVAHSELAISTSDQLDPRWLATASLSTAIVINCDPAEGLGCFARYENGELRRCFSANPVDIHEDSGLPFGFEQQFWSGERPLVFEPGVVADPLALPFHPQEFAEEALREWLGFRFTHPLAETDVDPATLPVSRFVLHPEGTELGPDPDDAADSPAGTHPAPTSNEAGSDTAEQPTGVAKFFGFGKRHK